MALSRNTPLWRSLVIHPKIIFTQLLNFSEYHPYIRKGQPMHYIITGPAGSGKTTEALRIAFALTPQRGYVNILRNTVPVRDMGFLPGTLDEKTSCYFDIYRPVVSGLKKRKAKVHGRIRYETTAFIRGKTYDDGVIVIDEAQNMTYQELYTVLTRVGKNASLIVVGDINQSDLKSQKDRDGYGKFLDILSGCDKVKHIKATANYRSDLLDSFHQQEKEYE